MIATSLVVVALFFFTLGYSYMNICLSLENFILHCTPRLSKLVDFIESLSIYIYFPSIILYKIIFTLNYVYIFIVIVYKSVKDRHKLIHINDSIKPIVKKFHGKYYNNRNTNYISY